MSTTSFWRKICQTVSGHTTNITDEIVKEILKLSKDGLIEGLLKFKPYSKKSYDEWAAKCDVKSCMKEFVHQLSQDLNLETEMAYLIMCNYLMFEYYGKIKEFKQITRIGTTSRLKESIWNFYTAERMFLLKTLRQIFEFVNDESYQFSKQYKEFIQNIKIDELQNNLLKQFENLIIEITPKNFSEENIYLENWLCRNNREQTEVLMILLLTVEHSKLKTTQLSILVKLFVKNNFSTYPILVEATKWIKPLDLQELLAAEIGCYIVLWEKYWDEDLSDFWKQSSTIELDMSLLNLHGHAGHTVVILIWLLLKSKSINLGQNEENIEQLLTKSPFSLLHSIISSTIFKNCRAGEVVLRATHAMLDQLSLLYGDRKLIYEQEGLVSIIGEFLMHPELREICLKARDGLDAVLEISFETFPYDFFSFTTICKALLSQEGHYKRIIQCLNNVPSFLSDMTWTIPKEEIHILKQSQAVFPDSDLIVFPAQTTVRSYGIFGRNLIQYKGTFSYFRFLEYLVNQLIERGIAERNFNQMLVKKVTAGYSVIIQVIKYCHDMDLSVVGVKPCLEKLHKILLILDGPLLHVDLVKLYFDVHNALMVYRNSDIFETCPEIIWKIFFPKLKPEYQTISSNTLLFNQYIFQDTIFLRLFQEEEYKEDHTLLLTYIEILQNILKVKFQYKNFQLSGITYLLNFVFLQHQSWIYNDENQKNKITLRCLTIFHFILQKRAVDLSESEKEIFYLCHDAFLNNTYIIESFLKLFIKEKYHFVFLMERESNWRQGPALEKLQCIRMQLALLLLIMNYRKALDVRCILDDKLPFIVKPIASYFTNSYSPVIAELSCRFLEKLAEDRYIPLLALLELDHYQIQTLFLERLRDPLEEDTVKLAIIDLINICIANQNGMTAAFFNLKCFMYWDGTESDLFSGDTVSDFMVDYLQNIKKSHDYFKNPLQLAILRLLHNLWLNHRENLIDNIATLKDFWPVMLDPFFSDFTQGVEVYTVILRIVNLEMNSNIDNPEKKLVDICDKFLKDIKQLNTWMKFVLHKVNKANKDHMDLLHAWMEFLILTKKITPQSFNDESKTLIIRSCLEGLNCPLTGVKNSEIVLLWSQLYLMLITSWPIYENQEDFIILKLNNFLQTFSSCYKYLPSKLRETVLCIVNRTIIDLEKYFSSHTSVLVPFLYPVGIVVDLEHENLESVVWNINDDSEIVRLIKCWLIIIFIGNSLLSLKNVEDIQLWFSYRQFLPKVMNSVGPMLQTRATLPFAKIAIDHMITYAESPLSKDYLKVDLFNFYYKVRPPGLTIRIGDAILSGIPANLKEWWLIFISLIRLNRILMNSLGNRMLDACFSFIAQHDQQLQEIISLTKFTVDMTALTLVCETLKFIFVLLCAKPYWSVQIPQSYTLLMEGVKTTINASVLSILGANKINFYNIVDGKQLDIINSPPAELLASVLNKLIEIIYWGSSCLKSAKPDLIQILDISDSTETINLLVENDFSVPRFELPIVSNLTYGMLLCLAHYLCKTLNQLSPETPTVTPRRRQISMTGLQDEIKVKSLSKIFEHCTATYEKCIGFMVYLQRSDDMPNEKLSSFLHYDTSDFSGSNSAVSQLDYHMVKNALEALMSFLAGEILCTIRILDGEVLFAYKRELCSEIQFFYEFVRKRTNEFYIAMQATPKPLQFHQSETDIIKKYMIAKMNANSINDVADNNFVLVICQWLIKYCQLSN